MVQMVVPPFLLECIPIIVHSTIENNVTKQLINHSCIQAPKINDTEDDKDLGFQVDGSPPACFIYSDLDFKRS